MKANIEYNTFRDRGESDLNMYLEEESKYNDLFETVDLQTNNVEEITTNLIYRDGKIKEKYVAKSRKEVESKRHVHNEELKNNKRKKKKEQEKKK